MKTVDYKYKCLTDALLSFQFHLGDEGNVELLVTSNLDDDLDALFQRPRLFRGDVNPSAVGGEMLRGAPLKDTDDAVLRYLDKWMIGYLRSRGFTVSHKS